MLESALRDSRSGRCAPGAFGWYAVFCTTTSRSWEKFARFSASLFQDLLIQLTPEYRVLLGFGRHDSFRLVSSLVRCDIFYIFGFFWKIFYVIVLRYYYSCHQFDSLKKCLTVWVLSKQFLPFWQFWTYFYSFGRFNSDHFRCLLSL